MNNKNTEPTDAGGQAARQEKQATQILYSNFNLIDVAFGGVNKRNNLIRVNELRPYAKRYMTQNGSRLVDCYRTYFRYPEAMRTHFKTEIRDERGEVIKAKDSVALYRGEHYADYFPVDFDSGDLVQSLQSAKNYLLTLESKYKCDLNILCLYFSGSKGFHVEIPSKAFGFEPAANLNEMFRYIAREMGIPFDPSVYDNVRL